MVHKVAVLALGLGCSAAPFRAACAEEGRRVVLWLVEGTTEEVAVAARARVEQLGEVVDLPPPAAHGDGPRAQELQAAASAAVERARGLYYEAAFEEAASLLERHLAERGAAIAAAGGLGGLANVLLWLAACQAKSDRQDAAVETFTQAIRLGLSEIDRSLFPPEVTAAFEEARRRVEAAASVSVTFVVAPEGAVVSVDGGSTMGPSNGPMHVEIAEGRHVVVARRPGYAPAARLVSIGDGRSIELTLDVADAELLSEQVAVLRRDGALRPSDPAHVALIAAERSADLVAVVGPDDGREIGLYDASGRPAAWPVASGPGGEIADASEPVAAEGEPPRAWRRWWFWLALVGGSAVVAAGVWAGVHFGTQNRDTFTLVVER